MDDDLELEYLVFDEDEILKLNCAQEIPEENEPLSDRWASWVNIIDR